MAIVSDNIRITDRTQMLNDHLVMSKINEETGLNIPINRVRRTAPLYCRLFFGIYDVEYIKLTMHDKFKCAGQSNTMYTPTTCIFEYDNTRIVKFRKSYKILSSFDHIDNKGNPINIVYGIYIFNKQDEKMSNTPSDVCKWYLGFTSICLIR